MSVIISSILLAIALIVRVVVSTTVLLVVAQLLTAVRLRIRIRSGRFWLDDACELPPKKENSVSQIFLNTVAGVIVALICSILLLVDMWIRTDVSQARTTRINAYWYVL